MQGDLLIIAIVAGLSSAGFTWYLEFAMNPGNILDFVRDRVGRFAAKQKGLLPLFDQLDEIDQDQKETVLNQIYWNIAREVKWFKILLCPICMSFYVFVVVGSIIIWSLSSGFTGWQMTALYFISWSTNVLTVRWIV